jgi:plasmid stabilization system protein ParE
MSKSFGGEWMASKLRFHPAVADDLESSTTYYDAISEDLGARFRVAIRNRFRTMSERPETFACIHEQQRAALVHGFPYVILFEKSEHFVTVLGVFHAASDQAGWFTRSG